MFRLHLVFCATAASLFWLASGGLFADVPPVAAGQTVATIAGALVSKPVTSSGESTDVAASTIHFEGDAYTLRFQDANDEQVINEYIKPTKYSHGGRG